MQFPNLPTDNLYKFIAISGLILIFLSTVLPAWTIHNMQLEQIEIEGEIDLNIFKTKLLEEETKRMQKLDEYLESLSPTRYRKLMKSEDKLSKELERTRETIMDLQNKNMQINIKNKKVKYFVDKITQMKLVFIIGNFIGTMFTYYGFSLWYRRLQKYQDQIIKNEATKTDLE